MSAMSLNILYTVGEGQSEGKGPHSFSKIFDAMSWKVEVGINETTNETPIGK